MSYPISEVKISNTLTDLNDNIYFTFNFNNNSAFNNIHKVNVNIFIILDIVYLKQKIELLNILCDVENKNINLEIKDFKLDNIPQNQLFNISKLCFEFYDCDSKSLLDTKTLIIQIVQEKNKIFKHLI